MKTYKVAASSINTGVDNLRYGIIKLDDNTGVQVGDKFNIKELKSIWPTGWTHCGDAKYSVSEMMVTAIKLTEGKIEFYPAIISEGSFRNSSGMLLKGMELTRL